MAKITYETADGIKSLIREEVTKNSDFVTCYENLDGKPGVSDKVVIPRERVVRIVY